MEPDDPLLDPGEVALEGPLPQDGGTDLGNLSASFTPNLDNLIPTAMDSTDVESDPVFTGLPESGTSSLDASPLFGGSINLGTLTNDLAGVGSSLLGAFVTNPQNAATQEQQQLTSAGITTAESGQIFSYLLIGLVIFLVFGFLTSKK